MKTYLRHWVIKMSKSRKYGKKIRGKNIGKSLIRKLED